MNEVLRQEKKYLITEADGQKLCGLLSRVMTEDPHNGPLGYRIRSLYFDTPDERDYYDKIEGVLLRRKIRLRIYEPGASSAKLEIKQKEGQYQKKRSMSVKREDAECLIAGDYSVLQKYREPFAAECYGLLHGFCYRPKTVVEYRRKAYIAKENKIRVTIDHQIIATESCWDLFSPKLNMYPALDPFNAVLEVKYNGFLLSYIKSLVNSINRSETTVSKYCLARGAGLGFRL